MGWPQGNIPACMSKNSNKTDSTRNDSLMLGRNWIGVVAGRISIWALNRDF